MRVPPILFTRVAGYLWIAVLTGSAQLAPEVDFLQDELEDWNGETQSKVHCVRCHGYPEPELLPAESWSYVLDLMGLYFGFDDGDLLEIPRRCHAKGSV